MMSRAYLGHLWLVVSIFTGAAGHTLLKHLIASAPALNDPAIWRSLLTISALSRLLLALLLLVLSFGAWLGALRQLDLSYAYAIASASIVLVALLAAVFLGESIAPKAWFGLVLIVIGCVLIAPAQARVHNGGADAIGARR
jgi:multidrug transporter EmrE-like cation transporter